jgi:hypothetical protein
VGSLTSHNPIGLHGLLQGLALLLLPLNQFWKDLQAVKIVFIWDGMPYNWLDGSAVLQTPSDFVSSYEYEDVTPCDLMHEVPVLPPKCSVYLESHQQKDDVSAVSKLILKTMNYPAFQNTKGKYML